MFKQEFLTRRAQMALVGVALWLLLALWSLSAFWQHIDDLGPTYRLAAKCGAMAGEVALLALILWHCFDKHLGVRRWALIFSMILSAVILVHAGALRGMAEAQTAQIETEKRLTERLTEMSQKQSAAIKSVDTGTQRERLAKNKAALAKQAEVALAAQKEVAETVKTGADKVKNSSTLPRWYLDGWMYSILFIVSLACVGIIFLLMMNKDDIDANYDGIPDRLQRLEVLAANPFPHSVDAGK